jgi:hypothetical protein
MKQALPGAAVSQVLLDDGEVCEVRWCRACDRGNKTIIPGAPPCSFCNGNRVVITVKKG